MPNRLIHSTSPYLQQHAHNPVNWFPWGQEALAKARQEDKLILVSIGYAACHWCHVMERESFTDPAVAALLDQDYVSIKVDREERPDLDAHFMEILTAMTGSGGWPLHVITTPELQPIHGGTYFLPEPGWGRPSFKQVLTIICHHWRHKRSELLQETHKLQGWLDTHRSTIPRGQVGRVDPVREALSFWSQRFDARHGGFGEQPKFPQPTILSFFLREAAKSRDLSLAQSVLTTLDRMASGGIRDLLGGAFHRYATDRAWQVPHFEIMLYDNALLARVYLEAWQLTGQERHAWVARGILDDLLDRFLLSDGAFLSSLDADSDGEEGLFYTWTGAEIRALLGEERGEAFNGAFVDESEGVVEGRAVLRHLGNPEELSERCLGFAEELALLARQRAGRPSPCKDDKVVVSWNALTVSILAKAGAAWGESRYLDAARRALGAIDTGELHHSRRGERIGEGVFLDDYACLIQAQLDLYEAGFDIELLRRAEVLAREMVQRFQPGRDLPLQLTPLDRPGEIPARTEWHDGVTPAGNSVAWLVLRRLGGLCGGEWARIAQGVTTAMEGCLQQAAPMITEGLGVLDFAAPTACEIVCTGEPDAVLLREIRRRLLPGLVIRREEGEGRGIQVCREGCCHPPVTTLEVLMRLLS
ncbi:MAG: thioredoxin domain-containing protein [Magnetococcales bacterium]|nr:thioredoxin domain-containing protein [Magnetococcales bacterium]